MTAAEVVASLSALFGIRLGLSPPQREPRDARAAELSNGPSPPQRESHDTRAAEPCPGPSPPLAACQGRRWARHVLNPTTDAQHSYNPPKRNTYPCNAAAGMSSMTYPEHKPCKVRCVRCLSPVSHRLSPITCATANLLNTLVLKSPRELPS